MDSASAEICKMSVIKLLQQVLIKFNEYCYISAPYINVAEAFNSINHSIQLHKL